MTLPVITLDSIAATAHTVRFNENANAVAAAMLFSIRASRTVGLRLTLHGGVFRSNAGVATVVGEQYLNLTPSVTNYVYASASNGTIGASTALPSGWPGSNPLGVALYTLVVGANAITSGTSYVIGRKSTGPAGTKGPTGESGPDFWNQRKTAIQVIGDSEVFSGGNPLGVALTTIGGGGNVAIGSTNFFTSVYKTRSMWRTTNNTFCIARGMELNIRFGLDSSTTFTPTDHIFFVGLYDITPGTPAQLAVEASSLVNCVGIGSDSTDSVIQLMHNDDSGAATKVSLGSNFPSKSSGMSGVGQIYDLRLSWAAGASSVSYTVINANSGTTASGTISTNLPASSQLLGWMTWAGVASGVTTFTCAMMCQVMANTRY